MYTCLESNVMKFCNLIGQSQVSISRSKPPKRFTTCSKPLVARLPVNDAQNLYKQHTAALDTAVRVGIRVDHAEVADLAEVNVELFPSPVCHPGHQGCQVIERPCSQVSCRHRPHHYRGTS